MASNALALLSNGNVPAAFRGQPVVDMNAAAQQGLLPSFAVIGYKGKNWRIKHRGDETLIKDARGVPVQSLEVVIVGVSPHIAKQFYIKNYVEGDDASPDCFSLDGITPDATSPKMQCQSCAACPQAIFGSKITEAGKKAKACQDSRRLAVVPLGDIPNDVYGGPMLLRLPPMSLSGFAQYSNDLTRYAAQPYMVRTALSFDFEAAYPRITFTADGWLDDDQSTEVKLAMENPLVERMLLIDAGAVPVTEPDATPSTAALAGGKPGAAAAAKPTPTKPATPAAKAPTLTVVQPTQTVAADPEEDEEAAALAAAEAAVAAAKQRRAIKKAAEEKAAVEAAAEAARVAAELDAQQGAAVDDEDAELAAAEAAAEAALAAARAKRAGAGKTAPATVATKPAATTAPPRKAANAFSSKAVETAPDDAAETTAVTTLKEAPSDMNEMIDNLLSS